MKNQRKDISSNQNYVTVRLKKAGIRFEILINRSAYHQYHHQNNNNNNNSNKKEVEDNEAIKKEIVDEVFTNAAKLVPADKNEIDKAFSDLKHDKQKIIFHILSRGEAQLSEVDRAEHTAAQTEYFSKVAGEVAKVALMEQEEILPSSSSGASSSSLSQQHLDPFTSDDKTTLKGGHSKKKKQHLLNDDDDDQPIVKSSQKLAAASKAPTKKKFVHVSKEIIEREMKNCRFKLLNTEKFSMDEQVNAVFHAFSSSSASTNTTASEQNSVKIIRDQVIWVLETPTEDDMNKAINEVVKKSCDKKPFKIIHKLTDKRSGMTATTLLLPREVSELHFPSSLKVSGSKKHESHIPTGDEDDLSKVVTVTSSSNNNKTEPKKEQTSSSSSKSKKHNKNKQQNAEPILSKKNSSTTNKSGGLEDELASLLKIDKKNKNKNKKNDDDSSSSSSDDDDEDAAIPKMVTLKKGSGKRR